LGLFDTPTHASCWYSQQATATGYCDSSRGAPSLIVDGAAVDLKFMRLLLTYEGHGVRTTASAEEALKQLADLRPE
jgi:hypothetical protein